MRISHRRLADVQDAHLRTVLQRQVTATERQIDALVFELYELTAEEIRLVEAATPL